MVRKDSFTIVGKNDQFHGFAYSEIVEEACSDTELSFWTIVGVGCVLLLLITIAIVAVCASMTYKRKYTRFAKARGERKGLTTVTSKFSCVDTAVSKQPA